MRIIEWIQVLLDLLAIGSGAMVMRGILRVALSGHRVVRFLECSLIASAAGFLPLTPHLAPIQGICMLSVYCSGVVVLAWRKFFLAGLWRPVFAFSLVAVLYLDVVSVSILLFRHNPLFAMASSESSSCFGIAQLFFASVFTVLGVLAVKMCHVQRAQSF